MLKELTERRDLMAVGGGLALGFAAVSLVQAVVFNLVAPLIAAFVGAPTFDANSFSISGSDFFYGGAIEAALVFAIVAILVYRLAVAPQRHRRD